MHLLGTITVAATVVAIAPTAALAAMPDSATLGKLIPGRTTKTDARGLLGEPQAEAPSLNQHTTLIYEYSDPKGGHREIYLVLLFDPAGKFVRYRIYEKTGDPSVPDAGTSVGSNPLPGDLDPFDSDVWRTKDWSTFDHSSLWTGMPAAGPKDQTLPVFAYRIDRKMKGTLDGRPMTVSLDTDRDDPTRHRIVLDRVAPAGECAVVRARLKSTYGEPSATRTSRLEDTLKDRPLVFDTDSAQWQAGSTEITQACLDITLVGVTVLSWRLEIEPSAGAPPLAPLFALNCPGLAPMRKASVLSFDPRERTVRSGFDPIARMTSSDGKIRFSLDGKTVYIDRSSGVYTVSASGAAAPERKGVCSKVDMPK